MQAELSPRRPTRRMQRTRRSSLPRSRRCSAVPSAESSSTNTASQSTPASSRSSRSIRGPTLSRSLSVGTTIASAGPAADGVRGDASGEASSRSRPSNVRAPADAVIPCRPLVWFSGAASSPGKMPRQTGAAMTRTGAYQSIDRSLGATGHRLLLAARRVFTGGCCSVRRRCRTSGDPFRLIPDPAVSAQARQGCQ